MSFRIPSTNPDLHAGSGNADSNFDLAFGVEVDAASGAIAIKEGNVFITKSSAFAAMTLALPTAGIPAAGGDDGRVLRITSTTAKSHTITTPASGINGASHILTFAAAADFAELIAYNGSWWFVAGTPTNVVLS